MSVEEHEILFKYAIKHSNIRTCKDVVAKLLGQDELIALENCKQLDVKGELSKLVGVMIDPEGKAKLEDALDELDKLSQAFDPDVHKLRHICMDMSLKSGTTLLESEEGIGTKKVKALHVIVEKDMVERLPKIFASKEIRPNEIVVSPCYVDLIRRLMVGRRLQKQRQPKMAEDGETLSWEEPQLLSEEETREIFKKLPYHGADCQKNRDTVDFLSRARPSDWCYLDSVSVISATSRKTKSTGILAKHHFKVKMVNLPRPKPLPGCNLDSEHEDNQQAQCETVEDSMDSSGNISHINFETLANKLNALCPGLTFTDFDAYQFLVSCATMEADSDEAEAESDGLGAQHDEIPRMVLGCESPCESSAVLRRINSIQPVLFFEHNGNGFKQHWDSAVDRFQNEVVSPMLELSELPVKLEGNEVPREALQQIESALSESALACFSKPALEAFFVGKMSTCESSSSVAGRIVKRFLKKLDRVKKPHLVEETASRDNLTLEFLKESIAAKACGTLKERVPPVEVMMGWWKEATSPVKSQPQPLHDPSMRRQRVCSHRAAGIKMQMFAPFTRPTSKQTDKAMKTMTYKVKNNKT